MPEIQSELLMAIHNLDLDEPNILKLSTHFIKLIGDLRTQISNDPNDALNDELERSWIELQEFRGYWKKAKSQGVGSLSAFRNAMALGQLQQNSEKTGLTLSTVHTMKGLEKDIVFLMGMCEGIFPDYRCTESEMDEELNNAFVAITRAKRWLYITYPRQRKMPWGDTKMQKISRFVQTIKTN
jgi:DNA helicase-2/ATP-dependent DNA helicase PcrA